MLRLPLLCFLLFLHFIQSDAQIPPGFKLRVTKEGLDYANRVASELLNKEIRALRIPDTNRTIEGGGRIRLSNIRLSNFREPKSTYSLTPPRTFSWELRNASIEIRGDWWVKKRLLVLLESSGSVKANASDVRIMLAAKFGRNATNPTKPAITAAKCVVDVGSFQLEVSGGIVATLMNTAKDLISAQLKPLIERELCTSARDFLLKDSNARLATFPVRIPIQQVFLLDYGLVSDPTVASDHCEVALKGRITPLTHPFPTSPYTPDPLATAKLGERMFYAWASDTMLNDLLYYAHAANMTRYLITKNTPGAGSFLRIRCDSSSSCLGSSVAEIPGMFPSNVETAEAFLITSTAPHVRVKDDGTASMSVNGTIDLYAYTNPNDMSTKKTIALCSVQLSADVRVRVENMRLVGRVNVTQFDVRIVQSPIDEFTLFMIESSIPGMATPILEKMVNERFAIGFPIPVTRGVSLIRPEIRLLARTVQVESDVQYVG